MSRPNEIKKKLFYKYSKNLRLLFDCYLTTDIVMPEYGGYVCPIGLTMHDIDTLKEGSEHQLSLEHFPPKSLGGKNTCLIRKDINSSMGRTIDKQLLQQIQAELFLIGRSSYPAKIRYDLPQLKLS